MKRSRLALAVVLFTAAPGIFAAPSNDLPPSTLAEDITKFAIAHPEATLRQAVEYANHRLRETGMNFLFDAQSESKTESVSIDVEGRQLNAAVGEQGECGEQFIPIPAVRVTKTTIELPRDGKIVSAPRPSALRLDRMQVLTGDLQTVLAEVEVPSEAFPHGVSSSGAILLELPLGAGAGTWWSRLKDRSKYLQGDSPYLVYEMAGGAPRFVDDESLYLNESEPVANAPIDPKNAYARYLRFKATHLVVRFSAPCT